MSVCSLSIDHHTVSDLSWTQHKCELFDFTVSPCGLNLRIRLMVKVEQMQTREAKKSQDPLILDQGQQAKLLHSTHIISLFSSAAAPAALLRSQGRKLAK